MRFFKTVLWIGFTVLLAYSILVLARTLYAQSLGGDQRVRLRLLLAPK